MQYEAVIFDLDGTLVGTDPEHRYQLVGRTLQELGITSSKHNIDRFWFEARRDILIKETFGLDPIVFWKKYREHDTIELRKSMTKPYADTDFIKELKKQGIKIGIVTGAPDHIIELEIGMIGQDNFNAIVSANSLSKYKQKPHPEALEECMRQLGVKNTACLYVGNADEDVETAKNAKVFDVLVDRGEHTYPDINPSLRIKSLYELKYLLELSPK